MTTEETTGHAVADKPEIMVRVENLKNTFPLPRVSFSTGRSVPSRPLTMFPLSSKKEKPWALLVKAGAANPPPVGRSCTWKNPRPGKSFLEILTWRH